MSTIKIRYVAQVEIDMEFDRTRKTRSLNDINYYVHKYLSEEIKKLLCRKVAPKEICNIEVNEMYLDVTEFERGL